MKLSGKPLKFSVSSDVSGSWTPIDPGKRDLSAQGVEVTSVLWAGSFQEPKFATVGTYASPTSGSFLQLRDSDGHVFYTIYSTGTSRASGAGIVYDQGAVVDLLETPMVMEFPISYFDSEGGNTIVILGEYK